MATLRRGSKINVFVDRVPPGPPLVAAVPGTAPLKRTLFEMIFLFPNPSTDDTKRTGRGDTYQQQSHRRHQRRSNGTDRQPFVSSSSSLWSLPLSATPEAAAVLVLDDETVDGDSNDDEIVGKKSQCSDEDCPVRTRISLRASTMFVPPRAVPIPRALCVPIDDIDTGQYFP